MTNEKKADPNLTRMILLNIFQRFQINKINFLQYLHLHNHPDTSDTFVPKCNAMTQTKTIRPKPFSRNLSNRLCTPLELQNLISYWPSDDNGYSDDELQKDPLKQFSIKIPNTKPTLTLNFEVINILKS